MMWGEESAMFDEIMRVDRLLNSLHMDQVTETPPIQSLPVEEEVSLGALLLRVLFSVLIRFSWLLWRILVLGWIPLYYPYVRYILHHRIPFFVGVAAWLVFLVDHDPLNFTTWGRPAGVWFTSADLYQLWYWLAAPILCRTAYHLPSLPRGIHARAALHFNDAFDVDISLSDYVIQCYKPTPPQTPFDDAFRLLLRETHLDRIDANIDNPECERKSRRLLPRMDGNAHLGWDMYSKVLDKRRQRRATCHRGLVVHRLRLEPDGQTATDREGGKKTTSVLAILEYSGTPKPHLLDLLQLAFEKALSRSMELNDLPPPSADRGILIDDLAQRCGPNNECKNVADTSSPKVAVETHADKGAKLLSSTEVPDDQKEEAISVRASEESELSKPINMGDEENEPTADEAGKKEYADSLETLRTSDEEMRKESITLEAEHLQEEDIAAAYETAAEEHHHVSGMDFVMLDTSLNDVQTMPSAEAQPLPSPTERQQPMLEENYTKTRYGSEEIQGSPENGATSIKGHQLNSDELQNDTQNPLPLTAEPGMASMSMPLALKNGGDLDEITKSEEMHNTVQVQLPVTPEVEPTAEDVLLPVDDDCEEEVSKELDDVTNVVKKDSILAEITSHSKSWPYSNDRDRDETFVQLPEQIAQEDGDQAMADLWEPEFEEQSDKRDIDPQEDCDMLDKTYLDVSRDEELYPYGDRMVTVMDGLQDPNFQQDVEMTSCVSSSEDLVMETPGVADEWAQNVTMAGISDEQPAGYTISRQTQAAMDLCHPIRATETADSDKLVLMNFPEQPASMTVYNSHAALRPEEQFNNSVSKYQVGQHGEDNSVPTPSLEKACLQTEDGFGKSLAQLLDRQPEMPQQKAIGYVPPNKEAGENDMAQVHPPQNPSIAPNRDSHAKIESAEVLVMGRIGTVDRDSRTTNFKNEEKIFAGKSEETKPLFAVQNIQVPETQEPRKIFDTLSTRILLPSPTLPNEARFDTVDGKTSFDFEEIQRQEDEELEREMVAAYVADSDTQNVSGALGKHWVQENILLRDCRDLPDGSISNDEVVEACPLTKGKTEPDDEEIPSLQRRKIEDIAAESQDQLPPFASQPRSRPDREDELGQVPRPFSQGSLDSSTARKLTAEQKARENFVEAPEEYVDESPSMERNVPKEPEDKAYRESVHPVAVACHVLPSGNAPNRTTLQPSIHMPDPDQEAPAHLVMGGLKLPAGNPMHDGSTSQPITDPSTAVMQRTQSPGPSDNGRLEKMKKAYIKAKSRPPKLFHSKTQRAPSTPHGTRSMGSIEKDEQLRSSDRMITLNRQYSTSTQTTEGIGNTDQQRPIKVIPIKALRARNTVGEESENTADHTRGIEGG